MNIKEFMEKVKGFFQKMNKKTRFFLYSALVVAIISAIAAALFIQLKPYAVLFTGLSSDEASAIVAYLEENGIHNYRLEGGDTIKVPSNQEAKLKASLLMEGYPKSGFAYETYRASVGTMSTESDRNIAYLQDLQDRMAAVIRCFDGVKDAVVTIVQEDDRRYILDSSNVTKASASVMVTMAGGTLSDQQADAILKLVARSVKGLEIENIAISDSLGNVYSPGGAAGTAGDASILKLQLEEKVNRSIRTQIMQVLTPLFGERNISVAVNSTVDVRHSVGESTKYTEPDWAADGSTGGKGIIGKRIYDQEVVRDGDEAAGGVAGTEANSDINNYVQNGVTVNGDETYVRNKGEDQYNVDTEKEQVERWAGTVSDVMVSVTINSEVAAGADQATLLGHIGRAAGINPDLQAGKISLYFGPFYEEPTPGILPDASNLPVPLWMIYAAIGGLVLLLVLLLVFVILKSKKKKKLALEYNALLEESFNPVTMMQNEPAGVDIMNIKTEKSMELRKIIRQFAEDNPEIAAYMLRTLLRGGEEQDV